MYNPPLYQINQLLQNMWSLYEICIIIKKATCQMAGKEFL